MIENIGNGMIKIGVKQEEPEESINGLVELKPILQELDTEQRKRT